MPFDAPRPAPLVPLRRLGPALAAQRVRRATSFVELSRRSGRRWAPDELRDVERAARALDDEAVIDIANLYGLPGRRVPSGDGAALLLDRSSASDLGGGPAEAVGLAGAVSSRLHALGRLCGFDPSSVEDVVPVVGLALTMPPDAVERLLGPDAPEPGDPERLEADLVTAAVVPAVGLLVAETDQGALVLTGGRPGRRADRTRGQVPSAATLGALVGATQGS